MKACLFCGKVEDKNQNRKTNLERVGLNTGNMLFWYSLSNILETDRNTTQECAWKKVDLDQYSSFITTELIWIQENTDMPTARKQFELVGDRPLVPISIGLQSGSMDGDFKIHEDTLKLLSAMQERCVLGIRGQYTAEVLNKNGIKNIQVIGCPSMYLPFDYDFKITKKDQTPKKASVNMRTMYSPLTTEETKFLVYSANHSFDFCEQTSHMLNNTICKDVPTFDYLSKWLNLSKTMFFDVDDWRSYMRNMEFSMGCRFHGNVVGLWERVPALFVTIDSRTSELCEHFSLPTMKMKDFDSEKDIRYYYDLADYSTFNKNYGKRLDEFISFLKRNNLPISKRIDKWYDLRISELQNQVDMLLQRIDSV